MINLLMVTLHIADAPVGSACMHTRVHAAATPAMLEMAAGGAVYRLWTYMNIYENRQPGKQGRRDQRLWGDLPLSTRATQTWELRDVVAS